jgi:hypothetical protein
MINRLFRTKKHAVPQEQGTDSFSYFVFKAAANKNYLSIALAGIAVQFIVFKICYPYADYFNDSYTYIDAAADHARISFRPIGYSRFLELIHAITTSDTTVVYIQFLTIQAGALFLFFTLQYFFRLNKIVSLVLLVALVFNPVVLYISNYISSDALFVGLSLLWIAQLIWIINQPKWHHLLLHAFLLFLIFNLRYAALYLPIISVFAIFLSGNKQWIYRLTAIALSVIPIFIEIKIIQSITKKETGTEIFSAFSGWMAANNALHMYPYIEVHNADFASADCVEFNKIVKQYFDTLPVQKRPYPIAGVSFIWGGAETPLKKYMSQVREQKNINGYFDAWHAVAPVYAKFSQTLVKQHPFAFLKYFMWPNAKVYFAPPLESLLSYNEGHTTVGDVAVRWFRYKSENVTCVNKDVQGKLLAPIPWLFFLINIIFVASFITLIVRFKKTNISPALFRTLLLTAAFWVVNFLFSTYAAPIVFRFQLFPMIVYTAFSLIMLQLLTTDFRHSKHGSIK